MNLTPLGTCVSGITWLFVLLQLVYFPLSSQLIHVVAWNRISLLLRLHNILLYVYPMFCLYIQTLGLLSSLGSVNSSVNLNVQKSLGNPAMNSSGCVPRGGIGDDLIW